MKIFIIPALTTETQQKSFKIKYKLHKISLKKFFNYFIKFNYTVHEISDNDVHNFSNRNRSKYATILQE